jgi:hypothetical protein
MQNFFFARRGIKERKSFFLKNIFYQPFKIAPIKRTRSEKNANQKVLVLF